MKAFLVLGMLLVLAIAANLYQYSLLYEAEKQNAALARELDAAHAAQLAERETFAAQLKLVREAAVNAATAHKTLSDKRDLSDADWLADVLASMWNKNGDSRQTATGMDAGTMQGAGSQTGTATGKDAAPVQRSTDTPRD